MPAFRWFLPFFFGFLDLIDVGRKDHRPQLRRRSSDKVGCAANNGGRPPARFPFQSPARLRMTCAASFGSSGTLRTKNLDPFADLAVFKFEHLRSLGTKPPHAQVLIEA